MRCNKKIVLNDLCNVTLHRSWTKTANNNEQKYSYELFDRITIEVKRILSHKVNVTFTKAIQSRYADDAITIRDSSGIFKFKIDVNHTDVGTDGIIYKIPNGMHYRSLISLRERSIHYNGNTPSVKVLDKYIQKICKIIETEISAMLERKQKQNVDKVVKELNSISAQAMVEEVFGENIFKVFGSGDMVWDPANGKRGSRRTGEKAFVMNSGDQEAPFKVSLVNVKLNKDQLKTFLEFLKTNVIENGK